jgi:phage shock protein A
MLKAFVTFCRGALQGSSETLADRNALTILDQQIRDCGGALDRARKALALALAQDQAETRRRDAAKARIADLEMRVVAALAAGQNDLAHEGAQTIADLETEAASADAAQSLFAREIRRLRAYTAQSEARLAELDRGRRIARAAESVRGLRGTTVAGPTFEANLTEAEATLRRLRDGQMEAEAAEAFLSQIDPASRSRLIAEKLAAEGFGPRLRPSAEDVLARLTRALPVA